MHQQRSLSVRGVSPIVNHAALRRVLRVAVPLEILARINIFSWGESLAYIAPVSYRKLSAARLWREDLVDRWLLSLAERVERGSWPIAW